MASAEKNRETKKSLCYERLKMYWVLTYDQYEYMTSIKIGTK